MPKYFDYVHDLEEVTQPRQNGAEKNGADLAVENTTEQQAEVHELFCSFLRDEICFRKGSHTAC